MLVPELKSPPRVTLQAPRIGGNGGKIEREAETTIFKFTITISTHEPNDRNKLLPDVITATKKPTMQYNLLRWRRNLSIWGTA